MALSCFLKKDGLNYNIKKPVQKQVAPEKESLVI